MRLAYLPLLLTLGSCAGEVISLARDPKRLTDCTAVYLDYLKGYPVNWVAAQFESVTQRQAVLDRATTWSTENGYLPCAQYQMCAAVFEDTPETVRVLVRPEARVEGWVPPAADLIISRAGA